MSYGNDFYAVKRDGHIADIYFLSFRIKVVMEFLIKMVIVSAVLLEFTFNTSTVTNAQGHDSHSMSVDSAAIVPVIQPADIDMVPADTPENSTKAKNSKKRAAKKIDQSIVKMNPEKKLSINQVMDITSAAKYIYLN